MYKSDTWMKKIWEHWHIDTTWQIGTIFELLVYYYQTGGSLLISVYENYCLVIFIYLILKVVYLII